MEFNKIIVERRNKTVYDCGDKVVKLFVKGHNKGNIFNEALNASRVEGTDIKVPALRAVYQVEDRWAIEYDKVEGKTLEELMKEHPEKLEEYMERFVEIQTNIHAQSSLFLTKMKDKYTRMIHSLKDVDGNIKYDLLTRLDGMKRHSKVCHGDFNPSNVIIDANDVAYVVDWSHTTQGNASGDAAMTYLEFAMQDQKLADLYMKKFCEKTKIEKRYVESWLSIVAAAQLSKNIESEREFLMRWIDIFDFQ